MNLQPVRTRVGKYELGRTLGEGTFGKVRFARNMESREGVAIKVMDKEKVLQTNMIEQVMASKTKIYIVLEFVTGGELFDKINDLGRLKEDEARRYFQQLVNAVDYCHSRGVYHRDLKIKREISTMKLIKHPNVVQLCEVMASKTKIYIVLEFVAGGELFDKIVNHGRLKEDEARRYFQQLINAVDYCHSRGVFHRDLKPENLLLDTYGNLKVSDFGLSALPQQVRKDGLLHTTCGTPNYVAPEVISGKGYDGAIADLWSCGVILCKETRILDPNPKTRITVPEILEDGWFKKGYKLPKFQEEEDVNMSDVDAVFNHSEEHLVTEKKEMQLMVKNAFELITMSRGLDLGNLFEKQMGIVKREKRFTSKHPAKEILSKIEESARPLGFDVQKQNYKVLEVAPSLFVVELRKAGGDTLEFQEFYKNLSPGLKDIMWKSEVNMEENE